MFRGIESLNEEIKTFIKIKKVNIPPEKSYITISKSKNTIDFENESNGVKNKYKYQFSKIFSENEDYYTIYQHISFNCLNDCFKGHNYTFISYGESNSEKHNLLFLDNSTYDKIKNKGLFPRLCKNLINNKKEFSISLMFVYENQLFDINDIIENIHLNKDKNKENKYHEYIKKVMEYGIKIQQNPNIIEEIKKIKINNFIQFYNLLNKYNNFFFILQNEDISEYNYMNLNKEKNKYPYIYSLSNFIYVIYLYDKDNNNKIISKINCIEFAANNNLITKNNNLSSSTINNLYNTKIYIKNSNTIESFMIAIKQLKLLEYKLTELNNKKNENIKLSDKNIIIKNKNDVELDFKEGMDNKLVLICKNLCFNSIKTKFRVIGCIYPNVGLNKNIMEILNFVYDFQKILLIKKNNLQNLEKYELNIDLIKNEEKDKIILNLREDCSTLKNTVLELKKQIDIQIEKIYKLKNKYKNQIDIIKDKFGFEGDINSLISGGPYTKEIQFVNEIKENKGIIKMERYKIKELEKENEKIKNENKKMSELIKTRIDSKNMIYYLIDNNKTKEKENNYINNKNKEEKIILSLEKENKRLKKLIVRYKQENNNKSEIIEHLPEICDININIKEKINKYRKEYKKEYENKLKSSINNISNEYQEEKRKLDENYKRIFDSNNYEIYKYMSENESEKNNLLLKKQSILNESILLYEIINNIFQKYLSIFKNIRKQENPKKAQYFEIFKSLEEFENIIKESQANINYYNFPITLKEVDKNLNKNLKKGDKKIVIEEHNKLMNNLVYNNLFLKYKESLDFIDELKKENKQLYEKINNFKIIDIDNSIQNIKINEKKDKNRKKSVIINKEILNRQLNNVLGDDIKNKMIDSEKAIVNSYSIRFRNSDIMRNNSLSIKNKNILNKAKIINIKKYSIINSTSKDKNKNKTIINLNKKLLQ